MDKQLSADALTELASQPLVLDAHGGLYSLSADGATRQLLSASSEAGEKAMAFGNSVAGRWLCTDQTFNVLIGDSGQWVAKPLGEIMPFWSLPYSNIVSIESAAATLVAVKARDCVYCVKLNTVEVRDWTIPVTDWIYAGWRSEKAYVLSGMSPRTLDQDAYPEVWGRPVTITVDGDEWRRDELSGLELATEMLDELIAAEQAKGNKNFTKRYAKECLPPLKMESILASIDCADGRILLSSVKFDSVQEEHWPVSAAACMDDYNMIALVELERTQPRLIKFFHDCHYACLVQINDRYYVYFLSSSQDRTKDVLVCASISTGDSRVVIQPGEIKGLDEGTKIFYLKIWHEAKAGHYGCIGVYTKNGAAYYLIRSDDALRWRVVHGLEQYGR